jgi:hypothetical protein
MNRRKQPGFLIREKSVTAPAAGEDQIRYVLPPRFAIVAEALVPVVNSLREAMAKDAGLCRHEFVMPQSLFHHLGIIQRVLVCLPSRVEGLVSDGVKSDESTIACVYRAAGRLEEVLSQWVDGYQEIRASHAEPTMDEVRELFVGVYRHHLLEVCNWLAYLVQAIADPTAVMQRRGVSIGIDATLTLSLTMTVPPEMDKLLAIAKRMQIETAPETESIPATPRAMQSGPELLGTIGALAFGIGVTKAVLGRHRG